MAYDMDDQAECPLCMEQFEMDDLSFFPCTCGYQICRFCWHRIRTDENGLCPACRKPYSENPADFKPLTNEELQKIKAEKKQKDLQKKLKMSENRKHLANVRVVQKNLVFVVGLSPRLSDPDVLKRHEYFGKFGKIHKVVINHSTQYVGAQCRHVPQGPSASAYVTYYRSDDALRAIGAVNNVTIENRTLKASLGTTKYCSHFMKNQSCPKTDCMYLHEPGDEAASFTKEAMQQGKHQEYEKKLHDQLFQQSQNQINRVKDRRPQSESGSVPIPAGSHRLGSADNSPPDASSAGSSGGGGGGGGGGGPSAANGSWTLLQPARKSRGRKGRKRNAENAAAAAAAAAARTAAGGQSRTGGNGGGSGSSSSSSSSSGGGGGAVVTLGSNQSDDENSTGSRDRQTDSSRSTPLSQSAPPAATPPPESADQPPAAPPSPPSPPSPSPPPAVPTPPSEPPAERPASPPPVPSPAPAAAAPTSVPTPSPAIATLSPPPGLSHPTPATTPAPTPAPGLGLGLGSGSGEWLMAGRAAADPLTAALLSQPTPPPEADEATLDDAADDLDFDPFEETKKGLSALLEREREQQAARQAAAMAAAVAAQRHQLQQQQQQQQALRLGAAGLPPAPGLTSFNGAAPRARLPPPGFSGPSGLGLGQLGHPPQQQTPDLSGSKMLPFLNSGGLNGLNGLNGLSRPPPAAGRARALSPHDTLFSDLSSMMLVGGQRQPPPPPTAAAARHDSLKDWQGLKKHFPNINISFSTGAPSASSGVGGGRFAAGQGGPARHGSLHGPAPPLSRFMSQPPKPATSAGWSGSGGGSDWTAMDPAIVSSGQLAGPRSDSPPHWLRSLEQLTETGPMYPPAGPPQRAAPPAALWTSTPPPGFNPAL